ncbi:MAG: hypothetical protein HZA46_10955 [Planctomycetales bacterium]|nr:hypothetical protein [Planctomycetales bacterium]
MKRWAAWGTSGREQGGTAVTANLWTRLRKPVGFVAAGVFCLSSFGLTGCVQTPKDLFGDRSQPPAQHHAFRAGSRSETGSESRIDSRNLLQSRDAAESDDPFLKEDRRSLKRQPVETATKRTVEDQPNRRAELVAGVKPQSPKSSAQAVADRSATKSDPATSSVERLSTGKVMQVTRSPRERKNFSTALDSALVGAGSNRSDEVEMLPPPPEKMAKKSETKPATVSSNPSPVNLVRPIPDEEPSVSANKSAEVPTTAPVLTTARVAVTESVPEMAQKAVPAATQPRTEASKPSLPIRPTEPFVVRITPAPAPAVVQAPVSGPVPQIARVNASQEPREVAPLTQSVHTDQNRVAVETGANGSPGGASLAIPTTLPSAGPVLVSPTATAFSGSSGSPSVMSAVTPQVTTHSSGSSPMAVRFDLAVEPEDDPQPLPLSVTMVNTSPPATSLASQRGISTAIATGPKIVAPAPENAPTPLLANPANARPVLEPLPAKASPFPVVSPAAPKNLAPIWFWLGGLCGACGLLGLILVARLESRSHAGFSTSKRPHILIHKLKQRRNQSATVEKVTERSAA